MTEQQTLKLQNDIAFCIDELEFTNEQIGEMLRVCEELGGISCEYFAEEFVFLCGKEEEHIPRYHDDNYLRINWSLK